MMDSSVGSIDMGTFTELQDSAGADFVIELIETFVDEAPQQLLALREAGREPMLSSAISRSGVAPKK